MGVSAVDVCHGWKLFYCSFVWRAAEQLTPGRKTGVEGLKLGEKTDLLLL